MSVIICTSLFVCFFLKDLCLFIYLLMWTIFKVFIAFVRILFLFYVLICFGHEACGILAS